MDRRKLDTHTLILAYANGFFPMPDPATEEIRWYNPDPRCIIPLDGFHCSRSLRRRIQKGEYRVTLDQAFQDVMLGCANRPETWINEEFKIAYDKLFQLGVAHSLEIWREEHLIGGIYGVAIGGAFFAESKFHRETDASKLALFHLIEHLNRGGFSLLEVQFLIPHLQSLGAVEIPAKQYMERLAIAIKKPARLQP